MTPRLLFVLSILLVTLAPAAAHAQDGVQFVYFAPGNQMGRASDSTIYAAGLGLERSLERHAAVQIDIAALSYFAADTSRTVAGVASFDGVFHPLPGRRVQPFVVGGYSLQFRDTTVNMWNVGVGMRHWFSETRALLLEYRQDRGNHHAPLHRYWTVRVGLAWR